MLVALKLSPPLCQTLCSSELDYHDVAAVNQRCQSICDLCVSACVRARALSSICPTTSVQPGRFSQSGLQSWVLSFKARALWNIQHTHTHTHSSSLLFHRKLKTVTPSWVQALFRSAEWSSSILNLICKHQQAVVNKVNLRADTFFSVSTLNWTLAWSFRRYICVCPDRIELCWMTWTK